MRHPFLRRHARRILALAVTLAACADQTVIEPAADADLPPDVAVDGAPALDTGFDAAGEGPLCRSTADCQGGDFCTAARVCREGRCERVGGVPSCDDGVACTVDACDGVTGRCTHGPRDGLCPTDRACDPAVGCVAPPSCEAGDTACQRLNHDPCLGTWSCDAATSRCRRSPALACDDRDPCTVDRCVAEGGAARCERTMMPNDCPAGVTCGRSPSGCFSCGGCDGGLCVDGGCLACGPCEQLVGGRCVPAVDGTACGDDTDPCTRDVCLGGRCDHGQPIDNDCGERDCGRSPSGCFACGPRGGGCDAGLFCQMNRCAPCPECQGWSGAACVPLADGTACMDEGDRCTQNVCARGHCTHPPVASDCGGRQCGPSPSGCTRSCGACPAPATCDGSGRCVTTTCPACQFFDGARCAPVGNGIACADDTDPCTRDVCVDGSCAHPRAPSDCGARECGPSPSRCVASCGACAAGSTCTNEGACIPTSCPECQRWDGAACVPVAGSVACTSDGDACTQDVCALGTCRHNPAPNDCGGRTCGPSPSGCYTCGPSGCDDGSSCTVDSCDGSGRCRNDRLNDCVGRQCGPSPSGCVSSCGTCAGGATCTPSGACMVASCGGAGEPCCGGAHCDGALVCGRSGRCEGDAAVTTTVYRFVDLCTSAHWHAIGATSACYPSSSGPTVGCGCGTRTVNGGGCAPTCWRREIAFTSALLEPSFGSFVRIHHCFEGGGNLYRTSGCSSYGDPTSIGWLATAPVGAWSLPVYLCSFVASGVREQFFAVSAGECPGGPQATWYARP